jgi:hypothetical protein
MITSGTLFDLIGFVIILFLWVRYRKNIKRPWLVIMILLGVFVPSYVIPNVIQHAWLNVLNLFFLLILSLTVFDLLEKGILGSKYEIKDRNLKKWQEMYPRLFKFQQRHPRLPYALLYGNMCAFFTYVISMTIMNRYSKQWSALGLSYFKIDEHMASFIIRSEGLNSPLKSLLLVILIWSAVALVVAFICSLFVRDPAALRLGAIPLLAFYSLIMPAPLSLFQRLLVASACATCAYISSKLCVLNISERICSLFTVKDSDCLA